jgi:Tfp pilus assembly protein PilE
MKLNPGTPQPRTASADAFTLVEVMVAAAVAGFMFLTLYMAFSQGFAVVQVARENLRATQIMQEKMETIRLYTWTQITNSGFIPSTFTAPFYAIGTNEGSGVVYIGALELAAPTLAGVGYNSDLLMVTVRLQWTSGQVLRTREMSTLVSRYGLQQYIY